MRWLLLLISAVFSANLAANQIRQVTNADGSIEFTNTGSPSNTPVNTSRQTIIYKSINNAGDGIVFSDQKPLAGDFEVLRYDCYACNPGSSIDWYAIALNTHAYKDDVQQLAIKYRVDPALVRAVIHAESAFKVNALSNKGAQGLMQLMPGTAKDMGVINAFDARQNIEGGVKYLAWLLETFNNDIKLATAAYNAGPGAVKRFNGIPPYAETEVYVERVGILHQRYKNAS
ncbi:lytic transglycosylase domain-containing protein [Methylophaga sp. OBS3]|uniref:lytic transglycosylase domain-containing protein n=1 Tax=Methylophaga sp. OBS3 TaxID=2991934 RepID=UPI002258CB09|nr:lytic transglycosylase domain-containing protein [Methylophaga sp. OBS3]MCX4188890.1 lytic transglycosylase domain-containing protein [Methylophaga sp. OBS3]